MPDWRIHYAHYTFTELMRCGRIVSNVGNFVYSSLSMCGFFLEDAPTYVGSFISGRPYLRRET